ncbi:hypothetical protein [Umezawaea sp.]|uniref:hypothetical protein n=1 Tax=Umezawaea sp. TaxID=1955258 RepID=UPI002ED32140
MPAREGNRARRGRHLAWLVVVAAPAAVVRVPLGLGVVALARAAVRRAGHEVSALLVVPERVRPALHF